MPFGLGRRKAQPTVDRQRQVDLGYVASRLAEGDLSLIAGCGTDSSVALTLHNVSLVESRLARADGGIREKIARGLYFYVTQPQSAELVEELVELDRGTVTITIEGIAFAGKSRHIGIGFGAIESISHSQNGMEISAGNGAQKIRFEGADRVIIPLKIHDREYNQHLSGKLMRLLLEAVIKISYDGGAGA